MHRAFLFFGRKHETIFLYSSLIYFHLNSALRIWVRRFLGEKKRKNCGTMYFSRRMQWDNLQKSDFFQLLSDLAISRVCKIQICTNAAQFTHMSSYSVYHSMYCHNRVILAVYSECVYTVWGHFSDIILILTGQNTMNYTYTCHHIVYTTECTAIIV